MTKSAFRVETPRFLLASVLSKAGWSVFNDLESKVACVVSFAGGKGDLAHRLDWRTGIG